MSTIRNNEVSYELTHSRDRSVLHDYHNKPYPRDFKKGGKRDVIGLPRTAQVQVNISDESKYSIGFEIEKNAFHRSARKEFELFCGYEHDRSCGVEAVTNILPLLPASRWRMKVYDMMHKAEAVIDDKYSPSDSRCGGHINVAVEGMDAYALLCKMRPYAGVLLALWRKRLSNTYCKHDPTMRGIEDMFGDYHSKYRVANLKRDVLEWRIPSRVSSVKQLMRRYELMYEVVDASVRGDGSVRSYNVMMRKLHPILMSMYEGDEAKVIEIVRLSNEFRKFIMTNGGHFTDELKQYIHWRE